MVLVGDVSGKIAIIVDDMADTCGTLVKAADVVIEHGAKEAIAIVTHGILSGNAIEALNGSRLRKIVVTNTVPHAEKRARCDRIETIDISPTVSFFFCFPLFVYHLRGCSLFFWKGALIMIFLFSWPRRVGVRTMARACRSFSSTRLLTRRAGVAWNGLIWHGGRRDELAKVARGGGFTEMTSASCKYFRCLFEMRSFGVRGHGYKWRFSSFN